MLTALAGLIVSAYLLVLFSQYAACAFASSAPRNVLERYGFRTTVIASGTCVIIGALYFWQVGTYCSYTDSRELGVVEAGSRAAAAGFKAGDEILAVNGKAFYGWGAAFALAPGFVEDKKVSEFLVSRAHEKVSLNLAVLENEAAASLGVLPKQKHLLLSYPEAVATSLRVVFSGVYTVIRDVLGLSTNGLSFPVHPEAHFARGMFLGFICCIIGGIFLTAILAVRSCVRLLGKACKFARANTVRSDAELVEAPQCANKVAAGEVVHGRY